MMNADRGGDGARPSELKGRGRADLPASGSPKKRKRTTTGHTSPQLTRHVLSLLERHVVDSPEKEKKREELDQIT